TQQSPSFSSMPPRPANPTLSPYTPLFRSRRACEALIEEGRVEVNGEVAILGRRVDPEHDRVAIDGVPIPVRPGLATRSCSGSTRSEEHTSELQSLAYLVCRLLLEKKKNTQ